MNNSLKVDSTLTVTVPQLFEIVGEQVCARWQALGDMDSKVHWAYGSEAEQLIAERYPAGVVYKAIAIKAGKSSETIRKAYYTFKRFDAETREKFNLCPYSVFQHARTQPNPIEVLQYYVDNKASLDEIEEVFKDYQGEEEIEQSFSRLGYPRIFYGIWREVYGIDPFLQARVKEHLNDISEIIKQANNE